MADNLKRIADALDGGDPNVGTPSEEGNLKRIADYIEENGIGGGGSDGGGSDGGNEDIFVIKDVSGYYPPPVSQVPSEENDWQEFDYSNSEYFNKVFNKKPSEIATALEEKIVLFKVGNHNYVVMSSNLQDDWESGSQYNVLYLSPVMWFHSRDYLVYSEFLTIRYLNDDSAYNTEFGFTPFESNSSSSGSVRDYELPYLSEKYLSVPQLYIVYSDMYNKFEVSLGSGYPLDDQETLFQYIYNAAGSSFGITAFIGSDENGVRNIEFRDAYSMYDNEEFNNNIVVFEKMYFDGVGASSYLTLIQEKFILYVTYDEEYNETINVAHRKISGQVTALQ